ncbi:MAG: hypothetical protein B6I20_03505 [Bacteroidetes bacterium 4572_117]|nr:MAG: hypothetical protein B6I20_03505 [Bacteroidetes bacterium 4572_117]
MNIPLSKFLDKDETGSYEWEAYLNQDIKTNVFYSNGSVYANQAWMLTKRLNYPNNYVMKGGLNRWVETILRPKKPVSSSNQTIHNQFDFRKAASIYFGGGSTVSSDSGDKGNKKKSVIKKKKKKKSAEGGC